MEKHIHKSIQIFAFYLPLLAYNGHNFYLGTVNQSPQHRCFRSDRQTAVMVMMCVLEHPFEQILPIVIARKSLLQNGQIINKAICSF